jgi:hypothetical protein
MAIRAPSLPRQTHTSARELPTTYCAIDKTDHGRPFRPGWFQLFVLDGPTPSHSQWVRIGGDPGKLGLWPDFPDFKKPGL